MRRRVARKSFRRNLLRSLSNNRANILGQCPHNHHARVVILRRIERGAFHYHTDSILRLIGPLKCPLSQTRNIRFVLIAVLCGARIFRVRSPEMFFINGERVIILSDISITLNTAIPVYSVIIREKMFASAGQLVVFSVLEVVNIAVRILPRLSVAAIGCSISIFIAIISLASRRIHPTRRVRIVHVLGASRTLFIGQTPVKRARGIEASRYNRLHRLNLPILDRYDSLVAKPINSPVATARTRIPIAQL